MNEEEPKVRKLVFTEFHSLDHRIGSKYCRDITVNGFTDAPTGWAAIKLHAKYWWAFKSPWATRRFLKAFDKDQ